MEKNVVEKGGNVKQNSRFNEDFWQEYSALVLKNGVPSYKAEWYVTWAVRFARSQRNLSLKARTAEHVKNFLNNFKQNANIKEWQVDQAAEAFRFLYKEYLKLAWAEKWTDIIYDIKRSSSLRNPNQQEPLKINSFCDTSTSKEVDDKHGEVIKRLRTEIRTRHYSIRTEQAYEDCKKS